MVNPVSFHNLRHLAIFQADTVQPPVEWMILVGSYDDALLFLIES